MPLDINPQWLSIVTGPNLLSVTSSVGRQPNLSFGPGFLVYQDTPNQQNVVEILDVPYSPVSASLWSGSMPTTVGQALDRLASAVVALRSGSAIP